MYDQDGGRNDSDAGEPWQDPHITDHAMIDDPKENEQLYYHYRGCCLGALIVVLAVLFWVNLVWILEIEHNSFFVFAVGLSCGIAIYYIGRGIFVKPEPAVWIAAIVTILLVIVMLMAR